MNETKEGDAEVGSRDVPTTRKSREPFYSPATRQSRTGGQTWIVPRRNAAFGEVRNLSRRYSRGPHARHDGEDVAEKWQLRKALDLVCCWLG